MIFLTSCDGPVSSSDSPCARRARHRTEWLTVALFSSVLACSEPPLSRQVPHGVALAELMVGPDGMLVRFPPMEAHIPSMSVAPLQLSDADLEEEIAAAGGHAIIMLKAPLSQRASATGRTAAIGRAEALAAREVLRSHGVEILRSFRYSGAVAVRLSPGEASRLRTLSIVDFIEPDALLFPQSMLASRPTSKMTAQDTSWGVKHLRIQDVWLGTFGPTTRGEWANITILDYGMDYTHRFFGDGPEGLGTECLFVEEAQSCYDSFSVGNGHGVHVGGIIAASDNGVGVIGIAHYPAKFASINVCRDTSLGPGVGKACRNSYIQAGLQWAIASGRPRHIVNMSLAGCKPLGSSFHITVQQAAAAGLLLISSAGNAWAGWNACAGYPPGATGVQYPARYPEIMAVSGTLQDDSFAEPPPPGSWPGSRFGPEIEIAAPHCAYSMQREGTYGVDCGTSMASAAVSGVAALLWSRNPGWSASQIRNRLKATAYPYTPATKFGSGRIDPLNAIYSWSGPLASSIIGSQQLTQPGWHVWSASVGGGIGSYSYVWYSSEAEAGPFTPIGSGATAGQYVDETTAPEFWLRLTVTSGTEVSTSQIHVLNQATNPCYPLACVLAVPGERPPEEG